MKVRVEFYGRLRETVGVPEREVRLDGASPTLGDLADRLRADHPELDDHLDAAAFAVGDRLVERDRALSEDDVVGVLPPVSGG